MKVAQINITTGGSTGHIMLNTATVARENGILARTYSPIRFARNGKLLFPNIDEHMYWGSRLESCFHYYAGQLLGRNGMFSYRGTKELIRDLERFNPDIIHLHNIHAFCINLPMLFRYIHRNNIKVVWTLHDCWAFTGNCAHFLIAKCDKWKTGCHHCPQPKAYMKMYIDTSRKMYNLKKKLFCGVKDMTIITPSEWLAGLARRSFLRDYPIKVINNGINLSVFKPTESDFRKKYGLENKKILLGVIMGWDERKGIDVFAELAARLDDEYKIVIVGADDNVRQRMPKNVLCINRTSNQKELAEIYTAADLFVNPTREDVFGMVNIEALACGTPVTMFRTGGCPEIIDDSCGSVVEVNDIDAMEKEIIRICEEVPYSVEKCLERAKSFDMNDRFEEYIELYKEVLNK